MPVIDIPAIWKAETEAAQSYLTDKFNGLKVATCSGGGRCRPDHRRLCTGERHGLDHDADPRLRALPDITAGSVTAKVLHDTPCPVWTGVHLEDAPAVSPEFATIMCAVDRTEDSVAIMRFAAGSRTTAKPGSSWCMPSPEPKSHRKSTSMRISAGYLEQDARKTIAQLQETAGVAAPLCLGGGEVSHVVRDSALGHSADLVVIGRGRATRTLGRLRSNVYSIIRDAPCPVISV